MRSQQDQEEESGKSYKQIALNQSVPAAFYLSSSITNCVKQNPNFE